MNEDGGKHGLGLHNMAFRLTRRQAMMRGKALGDCTVLYAKCSRFTALGSKLRISTFSWLDPDVFGGPHRTLANT